jgi:acyl dehydratase
MLVGSDDDKETFYVTIEQKDRERYMHYFEDLQVGETVDLGTVTPTQEEIITFARQFDPQYFHTDVERASDSPFGGLIASGWHTISLFMRLFVDALLSQTASLGSPGIDEIRWFKPVYPGDTLTARFTLTAVTPSKSRPTMGIWHSLCEMYNQRDELVMSLKGIHMIGRRPEI